MNREELAKKMFNEFVAEVNPDMQFADFDWDGEVFKVFAFNDDLDYMYADYLLTYKYPFNYFITAGDVTLLYVCPVIVEELAQKVGVA